MAGGGGRDSVAPSDTGLVSYRSLGSSFPPVGPLAILAALFLCKSLLCRCCCCYNALLSIGIRRISPSSFFSSVFCFVQAISTSSPPTRTFSVFLIVSLSLPAPTSHLLVALRPLDAPRQCFFFEQCPMWEEKETFRVNRRLASPRGGVLSSPPGGGGKGARSAPAATRVGLCPRQGARHTRVSFCASLGRFDLADGDGLPDAGFFFLFNLFAS